MAQPELIDSHVSLKQCKQAVHALHAYQSKKEQELQESELLPAKEQNVWLNVTVKKISSGHKFKPVKMYVFHVLDY
jgi:ribosome biogenesis protein UTP30